MKKMLCLLFIIININVIGQSFYINENNNYRLKASSCDAFNNKFKGIINYNDLIKSRNSILIFDRNENTNQNNFFKINLLDTASYQINDFVSCIKHVNDSTYYVLYSANNLDSNYQSGFLFLKLINNQIINSKYIKLNVSSDSTWNYSDNKIIESNNFIYILFSFYYGAYIIKFNKNDLTNIWSKLIYSDENKSPGFDIKITSNDEIIGVMKDLDYLNLFKLNYNGNLIWSKTFLHLSYRHGKNIFINDNYLYVGGALIEIGATGNFDKIFFSKFDLNNGNLIDSKVIQSNVINSFNSFNIEYDGFNFYYFADFMTYNIDFTYKLKKVIGKFDLNNSYGNAILYDINSLNFQFDEPFYTGKKIFTSSNSLYVFDNLKIDYGNFDYNFLPYFMKINKSLDFNCNKIDTAFNFIADNDLINSEVINSNTSVQDFSISQYNVNFSIENISFPTIDICLLLSEKENDISNLEILVYPNPANDRVYINIPENNYQHLEIEIIDFSGKTIKKENTLQSNNYIDVNHLNNGVYFLRISLDNQILYSNKLLINR